MNPNESFDLIVIGAGTGGTGVARMAAAAGWKVAVSIACLMAVRAPYAGVTPKKC